MKQQREEFFLYYLRYQESIRRMRAEAAMQEQS
jgi:hypothetical protein